LLFYRPECRTEIRGAENLEAREMEMRKKWVCIGLAVLGLVCIAVGCGTLCSDRVDDSQCANHLRADREHMSFGSSNREGVR
jgi:hypothetical protein